MLKWIRRRRMRGDAKRRFQIALARSEEALLDTHVENLLHLIELFDGERDPDDLLEMYVETLGLPPTLAAVIETRALARLGGWTHEEIRRPRFVEYDEG